ncbi:hypothetical protein BH24ACT7_BH24ACT7_24190 [soil metagenome]
MRDDAEEGRPDDVRAELDIHPLGLSQDMEPDRYLPTRLRSGPLCQLPAGSGLGIGLRGSRGRGPTVNP